ncbi:NUDIX hydrolase [Paraburkholderia phosphatilytica]|uniref:NUDIX hydrolase n=1 Tax=Paraburkholderia phosphatilytica TaxID=2282883 RepID=UPI001F0C7382|nr:NUDIX domain-containing protein [Paraburkholderia phosphatilytica]
MKQPVKQRATVICRQGTQILLVSRQHGRWALPGGRPKPGEDLAQAAARELLEETSLHALGLSYLFEFVGAGTHHRVYIVRTAPGEVPKPGNEIARCRWVEVADVPALAASIATKGIVDVLATPPVKGKVRRPGRRGRQDAFSRNVSYAMREMGEIV